MVPPVRCFWYRSIFPHIITWAGTVAGLTQAEILSDADKWMYAMGQTFDRIGNPDVSSNCPPGDTVFVMGLPSRVPGRELEDNELYQFIETPFFDDESEYKKMMEMGWGNWYGAYMMQIQNPPMTDFQQLGTRYGQLAENCGKMIGFLAQRGIETISHSATAPIYDTLSMVRSMEEFAVDLLTDPGPIVDIMKKYQPEEDQKTISMLRQFGGTRVSIYAMRSCAPFISPTSFKEYVWPTFKQTIETYHEADIRVVIHADSNWLPMLELYTQLPKASVHFEFDGMTDIFKAYDIIGGWHSMRGDVPATMLAMGTPDQVSEYCEKLITGLCMKGGVMLGSGCEVPLNAKMDCVKAMMDSVKE